MKKLLSDLCVIITVLMLISCVASYAEIICKNVRPNPQYSNYNVLVGIFK